MQSVLPKEIEHGWMELNFICLCMHQFAQYWLQGCCMSHWRRKRVYIILEILYILGSGVWLFPFHHVIEVEARWNMNMELDPDIFHIWFGPTVRSKLPPGASYPKLIYFLFSWSKYILPQAFGVNRILWLFISTIRACLFDSSLFLSSKNLNVPQ